MERSESFVRFVPTPRARMWGHLVWFGMWLVVTLVASWLQPSPAGHGTHQQLGLPACPSVLLTDRPCPGCGLTTSFALTVRGRLGEAFLAHAFGPVVYLLFGASALACLYGYATGRRFDTDGRLFNIALAAFLAVFLVYGGWRFFTMRYP